MEGLIGVLIECVLVVGFISKYVDGWVKRCVDRVC